MRCFNIEGGSSYRIWIPGGYENKLRFLLVLLVFVVVSVLMPPICVR